MAADAERKPTYPYMSINVWAEVRRAFTRGVPTKVDGVYLQSLLSASPKSASNFLPQLKRLGLLDSSGAPTDLAKRYRLDSEYQAAAAEIVANTYPDQLRELYPGPQEELPLVANWFMLHTGGGQISSTSQARFYLMLVSLQLPTAERQTASKGGSSNGTPASARKVSQPKGRATSNTPAPVAPTVREPVLDAARTLPNVNVPGLHLDIQIHIDADASIDQIDAVFASMAKHIYRRD